MSGADIERVALRIVVNGQEHHALVDPGLHLADFLRQHLGLNPAHVGCETGVCGACKVLIEGAAVRSCRIPATRAEGMAITTIEGLSDNRNLRALQGALSACAVLRCGLCSTGVLLTAVALLERAPRPSRAQIRDAFSDHGCRCTSHEAILDAVEAAARHLGEGRRAS